MAANALVSSDREHLLQRHARIIVIASSSGFYDFAAGGLPADTLRDRVHLWWGACAPDHLEPTPWERVFYPLNGLEHAGFRWFAYPNHNLLKAVHPETSNSHDWRDGPQERRFLKADLESQCSLPATSRLSPTLKTRGGTCQPLPLGPSALPPVRLPGPPHL